MATKKRRVNEGGQLKLHWIGSTTLSLMRAVRDAGGPRSPAPSPASGPATSGRDPGGRDPGGRDPGGRDPSGRDPGGPLRVGQARAGGLAKSPKTASLIDSEATRIADRLVTASVAESAFWEYLIDEVVSAGNDPPLSPQLCEVALLRAGHSQLQSDQTAAAIFRCLDTCRRAVTAESPRLAEQLRLRYAPLKQAYEAYGPGMLRGIGNQIWNGSPPKGWWPTRVSVHAVAPIRGGDSGRSTHQATVWIEAVLTDISAEVPEWLRLVYQLTQSAVETHTRTHSGSAGVESGGGSHAGGGSTSTGGSADLPWTLGTIPLILDQAAQRGLLADPPLPIEQAVSLWLSADDTFDFSATDVPAVASIVDSWWRENGQATQAMPIALKQLAGRLKDIRSSQSGGLVKLADSAGEGISGAD